MLGDIVLCPEFAAGQAAQRRATASARAGAAHHPRRAASARYDHGEQNEEKEMFALQDRLLVEWVAEQVEAYQQDRQDERDRRLLDKSRYFEN